MNRLGILAAFVAVAIVSILTCGCRSKAANGVSVQGEVSKEIYFNMMGGETGLPLAYHVKVYLHNSGTQNILFDEIQGAFVPSQGQPLIQSTFAYDKSKGEALEAYQSSQNTPTVLEPGKSLEYNYTTDGYTMDLLATVGNQPLQFHIVLFRHKSVISGPYVANLPDLFSLPQYELTLAGEQKAELLPFKLK
jgi:hypothetical protein